MFSSGTDAFKFAEHLQFETVLALRSHNLHIWYLGLDSAFPSKWASALEQTPHFRNFSVLWKPLVFNVKHLI